MMVFFVISLLWQFFKLFLILFLILGVIFLICDGLGIIDKKAVEKIKESIKRSIDLYWNGNSGSSDSTIKESLAPKTEPLVDEIKLPTPQVDKLDTSIPEVNKLDTSIPEVDEVNFKVESLLPDSDESKEDAEEQDPVMNRLLY